MDSRRRFPWRRLRLPTLLALALLSVAALARTAEPPPPDIRYVVLHRPGPAWRTGVDPREQLGIAEHVRHYRQLAERGALEMGGPYLDAGGGGMMVPTAGASEAEIRAFAAADPAVASGLLEFEIRPWYVAMQRAR